jgi:hypothetical protein
MSKHNLNKKDITNKERLDATRGSKLWEFNHFRTQILTGLLNDLVDLNDQGLESSICKEISRFLDYFANSATEIPRGGVFAGPIYLDILKFKTTYDNWNGITGSSDLNTFDRGLLLAELRRGRQKISDKARTLQYLIQNNIDQILLESAYGAISELIMAVPELFKSLGGAFKLYIRRGGKKNNV